MFPFQSGELSFQVFNNDLENHTTINTNTDNLYHLNVEQPMSVAASTTQLLLQPHHALNVNLRSPKTRKLLSGKSTNDNLYSNNDNNNEDGIKANDIAKKKVIHREVERQRRQEMSNLYTSLRSLLPMEYVMGKRSVSDHISEATRYIKDLEKNVKDLGEKRDKLKDSISSLENQLINRDNIGCSSSSSTTSTTSRSSSSSTSDYNVSIHIFSKTVQIEIMAGVEDSYPLSKAVKVLSQEGLDVVSCVSNKVNQGLIHIIYCEVNDVMSVDSRYLQEQLMSVSSCE